ncbi:MAG TPA: UvrD-helicase domain-containing protein [Dissulfurispiraceae bacterium]|nr:UvrD-helicase domain-containing protein [Dissulfurispiraceae bacterium]
MDIAKHMNRLNTRQREAVLQTDGPLLVLAGAGSGKTRVITTRVAYLLSRGIPSEAVLAVTFTNKAAKEMRERVMGMLKANGSKPPLISTFHSLCMNILRREIDKLGFRRDFTLYDTSDQHSLIRNLLSEIRHEDKSFKPESILERISLAKNDMPLPRSAKKDEPDDIEVISDAVYPKYREAMKTLNAVDFDDLLLHTLQLFREHPDVLEKHQVRFRYIMVDEYQDTNRVQYSLVSLLAGKHKNLCVVGDDDQSIYGWRGANLGNILDFERDFPGTVVVRLEQNYRSFGNILQAANGVIRNNKKRMEKSLWTNRGNGPKVSIFHADEADDEAQWVADRIELLKFEQRIAYDDVAILYRANLFSRTFEEALRRKRIPYTVVGGTSYFEHREIKDLASYLKICANPRDDLSLLRVANVPKRGLGPAALGKLDAFAKEQHLSLLDACRRADEVPELGDRVKGNACGLAELIDRYSALFSQHKDMSVLFRDLIDEINYREYLHDIHKNPQAVIKRIEGYENFISSLAHYEKKEQSPNLHGFLEALALTDMLEQKEEKNTFGVTLISFHSSKGLEFPIVFIVGAEEGILPHKKSASDAEEERRLFYVGITRAMKELFITHARYRMKYGKAAPSSPSRFLEELPPEVTQNVSRRADDGPDDSEKAAVDFFSNIQKMLGK